MQVWRERWWRIAACCSVGFGAVTAPLAAQILEPVEGPVTDMRGVSRGGAWGDVDGDGYPELLVTRPGLGTRSGEERDRRGALLFRNRNGHLVPGERLPIPSAAWEGATWVDLDDDGDLDLSLVGRSGAGAAFVENRGTAGLAEAPDLFDGLVRSASMTCWADADGDGLLDAFVVGYGDDPNRLFRGVGPWRLEPVALPPAAAGGGASRACVWADVDADGLPELFVANARMPNVVLRNRGALRFTPADLSPDEAYSYGLSAVDFDGDGVLDVFVANFDADNALYRGLGDGRLERVAEAPESAASKGHSWGDFDLDGRLDLYLGSGTPAPGMYNRLYLGRADGRFDSVEAGVLGEHADTSAAVAAADVDGDGDLDLFVANWGSAGSRDRLYRNTTTDASWLKVRLRGRSGAIGAQVSITWHEGDVPRRAHRWVSSSTGYAGQDDGTVHFGLGSAEAVDEVRVRWPSGCVTIAVDVSARTTLAMTEGDPRPGGPCGPPAIMPTESPVRASGRTVPDQLTSATPTSSATIPPPTANRFQVQLSREDSGSAVQ